MLILTEDYTYIEFNNSVTYVQGIWIRVYMCCACVCVRARVVSFLRKKKVQEIQKPLFILYKQVPLSQPNYTAIINFFCPLKALVCSNEISRGSKSARNDQSWIVSLTIHRPIRICMYNIWMCVCIWASTYIHMLSICDEWSLCVEGSKIECKSR